MMDNMNKTKGKHFRRRILTAVCAITIAMLQCAVVLTIETETVFGESVEVSVNVIVTNDKTPGSASGSAKLDATKDITIEDPESETGTRTVKGRSVGDFVSELNLSENPDKISPNDEPSSTSLRSDDVIVKMDGNLTVFKKNGDIWEEKADVSSGMDLEMKKSYSPIRSITISPASFTPEKGKAITFTASASKIDKLFESDQANYLKVTWSKEGPATITSSTDTDATITPNGEGTITVTATLTGNNSVTANSRGTIEPTTTNSTTVIAKDLSNATVHSDGKLEKGKSYSNSEMKSHLTLKDPNGKVIDKKNWDVISVSRDGNSYRVTIKASSTGKKNGYSGLNESTVKATKSSTMEEVFDKTITSQNTDGDLAGATFGHLRASGVAKGKKKVQLKWTDPKLGAAKYIVYGNRCSAKGRKYAYARIGEFNAGIFSFVPTKILIQNLEKGTYYKFVVVAVDNNDEVVAISKTVHVTTNGGKKGNDKSVKRAKPTMKSKYTIGVGKTKKLKVKTVKGKKKAAKHRAVAWESTDTNIATVSKGKVTARGKGTCTIFAYAQNGVYTTFKITVK